jgi:hypothetical protein
LRWDIGFGDVTRGLDKGISCVFGLIAGNLGFWEGRRIVLCTMAHS